MSDEEWLSLRRENKEHCYRCGFNLSRSEISRISEIEFQAIMDGSQKTIAVDARQSVVVKSFL